MQKKTNSNEYRDLAHYTKSLNWSSVQFIFHAVLDPGTYTRLNNTYDYSVVGPQAQEQFAAVRLDRALCETVEHPRERTQCQVRENTVDVHYSTTQHNRIVFLPYCFFSHGKHTSPCVF